MLHSFCSADLISLKIHTVDFSGFYMNEVADKATPTKTFFFALNLDSYNFSYKLAQVDSYGFATGRQC